MIGGICKRVDKVTRFFDYFIICWLLSNKRINISLDCFYRPHEYPFERLEFGRWQIRIGSEEGTCKIKHMSRLKLVIRTSDGNIIYR